ncbi:MAG: hypothetical protein PHS07_01955 [Patescibacteria group bacterium]|nr:hypothetical protein [Patescibacteria group bacterium]
MRKTNVVVVILLLGLLIGSLMATHYYLVNGVTMNEEEYQKYKANRKPYLVDGVAMSEAEYQEWESYKVAENKSHIMPDYWRELGEEERIKRIETFLATDKTDEHRYTSSGQRRSCGCFSAELYKAGYDHDIPVCFVKVMTKDNNSHENHGINAVLIGEDYTHFSSWYFIEPQTDERVQIESWSIPKDRIVHITRIIDSPGDRYVATETLISYEISNDGDVSLLGEAIGR